MKFKEALEQLFNEADGYTTFKQVEKDLKSLSQEVNQIVNSKDLGYDILSSDMKSVKLVIGQEVKSTAKQPKSGKIKGRRNQGKSVPVIQILFYDSFWKDYRAAETFWTVKEFNNWLTLNRK